MQVKLAVQASLSDILPLKITIGYIQSLYVFIVASPKRHAKFCNVEVNEIEIGYISPRRVIDKQLRQVKKKKIELSIIAKKNFLCIT